MATEIKVWEIRKGSLLEVKDQAAFREVYKEDDLEEWIAQNPSLLGEELLVIGRERRGAREPDLLCIDSDGRLVVVELKRELAPREAVAQALDYASLLQAKSADEIRDLARDYLKKDLEDAFEEQFGEKLANLDVARHRIFVVAPSLDEEAERVINYLAKHSKVHINAVFFTYKRLSEGKDILIRSVLVPESAAPSVAGKFTESRLLSMASDRDVRELVEVCRSGVSAFWDEECAPTAEGSFRYWTDNPKGGRSIVFGINVSGGMGAPKGELEVWIRTEPLADVAGSSKEAVEKALREHFKPFSSGRMDFIVRLKSKEEAEGLVAALRGLVPSP